MKNRCYILLVLLCLSAWGCSGTPSNEIQKESTNIIETKTTLEAESITKATEVYAEDKVVNAFISEYNDTAASPFTDIKKGNIRTKYHACSGTYYFELLNSAATHKICIIIDETNENAELGTAGMKTVFHDCVKDIDSSLSDEEIDSYFDDIIEHGIAADNLKLGNRLIYYYPEVKLSNGYSRGHIKIEEQ